MIPAGGGSERPRRWSGGGSSQRKFQCCGCGRMPPLPMRWLSLRRANASAASLRVQAQRRSDASGCRRASGRQPGAAAERRLNPQSRLLRGRAGWSDDPGACEESGRRSRPAVGIFQTPTPWLRVSRSASARRSCSIRRSFCSAECASRRSESVPIASGGYKTSSASGVAARAASQRVNSPEFFRRLRMESSFRAPTIAARNTTMTDSDRRLSSPELRSNRLIR